MTQTPQAPILVHHQHQKLKVSKISFMTYFPKTPPPPTFLFEALASPHPFHRVLKLGLFFTSPYSLMSSR